MPNNSERCRLLSCRRSRCDKRSVWRGHATCIERFKSARLLSVKKRKTKRSPASVKHEIDLLSQIFTLAVTWGLADPCSRVSKFKCRTSGKPKHLATMIPFVIGTGARKSEQLIPKVRQCDFFRNLIIFDRTKSNRPRVVEMNSEVREILLPLCKGKRPDDHVGLVKRLTSHSMTSKKRLSVLARMRE